MAGQGRGRLVQAEVQADGVGQTRREEERQPFGNIQRGRMAVDRGGGVGGDAREQGAVVRVELGAGGQGRAQVAEGRAAAGPQHGQDAGGQAAGREGAVAEAVRARDWGRSRHRFGAVDEASSASYSAAVSHFFSSTRSLRVWPVARPSFTSWATRS